MLSLDGRVVFVTGGGKNLGRRFALDAAAAGAAVTVNALSDEAAVAAVVEQIRAAGGRALAAMGDVTDPEVVRRAFEDTRRKLGPVTVVVHCAAARAKHLPVAELSPESWARVVSVVLDGAFLCAREALPDMVAAGYGRFLFISGQAAQLGLPIGSTHGAASKAGLSSFVRVLAQEHPGCGITANVISPGMLATDRAFARDDTTPTSRVGTSTIDRLVRLEEITALGLYLCSVEAGVINGETILADGGMVAC